MGGQNSVKDCETDQRLQAGAVHDDWYLGAHNQKEERRSNWLQARGRCGLTKRDLGRITAAVLIGICGGLSVASLQPRDRGSFTQDAGPATRYPSSAPATSALPPLKPKAPRLGMKAPGAAVPGAVPATQRSEAVASSSEELARVRARNRRLEALIFALRHRSQSAPSKAPQEQSGLIGQ